MECAQRVRSLLGVLSFASLFVVFAGCSVKAPPAPPPRPTTEIRASVGTTWNAVIDALADRHLPIKTIDRESGLIAAEARYLERDRASAWADCGGSFGIRDPATSATFNILVRGDTARSTVRVTARWVREVRGPEDTADPSRECATRNVWESDVESRVRAIAEGHN